MGIATHASDLRRWKSFQGQSYQEGNLIERLTSEMDERPRARYELDEEVKTPDLGIRGITDKYYSNASGWHYTFFTRNGLYNYKESQLLNKHEALFIQDVIGIIGARG
jgi:hypothetical protein